MTRAFARDLLFELVKSESLRRHCHSISLVMEAYARKYGEDEEQWSVAGMLHDADYEAFPEKHPRVIVEKLRTLGEEEIAHAISAHYTKWNIPHKSLLDKALLACDELTGFIIACCQIRPDGVDSLTSRSVIKKLKQKGFAAKVDRDEIYKGIALLEVEMKDHIDFIIEVLKRHKKELEI